MDHDVLAEWNPWWARKPDFKLVDRDIRADITGWLKRKEIVAIVGVRRSGKTSLFKLIIAGLLKDVDAKNIFFIKGDDERVRRDNFISDAIDSYRELMNPKGKVYVFVDEVQEIPGWDATLKRMYDLELQTKFFISGSNFSMLKEDLSFKLAGRCAYFDVYPFSFKEFLMISGMDIKNKAGLLLGKQEIAHHLLAYMEFGGFPEVVLEKDAQKKGQLLQFYFDTIVYRDIIRRREIRSPAKMERMISYFLQNIANLANFSKVAKLVSLSTDSIGEYVRYLQDSFFLFAVPLFAFSVKKQEINMKKMYCVDTGLRNVGGFRFSQDYGRLMENMAFIELRRRASARPLSKVFYWSDRTHEVDFVVKEGVKVSQLIQVCGDFGSDEVRIREIEGLKKAMKELKLQQAIIITKNEEQKLNVDDKTVKVIPLWKWLLE